MWNKIEETTFSEIYFLNVSGFVLKENHVLIEVDNPTEKTFVVEEELCGIDRDAIGSLEDLLRLVLINEECRNHKVVVDGGELTGTITQKKKPDVLQPCRCPVCHKCYRQQDFLNRHPKGHATSNQHRYYVDPSKTKFRACVKN